MQIEDIEDILNQIKGCTFATLDATTKPSAGVRKKIRNEGVMLFTNKGGSAYEAMVKRRLESVGRDPASFTVSDLPWGERVDGTPIIVHRGVSYLQAIVIRDGECECFIGNTLVDCDGLVSNRNAPNQGLPEGKQVICRTYRIENLSRIVLMGDVFVDGPQEGGSGDEEVTPIATPTASDTEPVVSAIHAD